MIGFAEFAASLGLTELQLSLGLIGFSLLVLVMIYNAMRIRKVEVEDASNSVGEAQTAEPNFSSIDGVVGRSEPTLGGVEALIATPIISVAKIDPLIDCVVALRLPNQLAAKKYWVIWLIGLKIAYLHGCAKVLIPVLIGSQLLSLVLILSCS